MIVTVHSNHHVPLTIEYWMVGFVVDVIVAVMQKKKEFLVLSIAVVYMYY
jgi:hypothetical protein